LGWEDLIWRISVETILRIVCPAHVLSLQQQTRDVGWIMKIVIAAFLAALFLVHPAAAQSQAQSQAPTDGAPLPPTIVQDLNTAGAEYNMSPALGAAIGATTGIVVLNVVTSGLVLAPVIGVTASNVLGGAWLGSLALTPPTAELLFHSASVVAVAFATGTLGYFIAEE